MNHPSVDVVLTAYNEDAAAITATLRALHAQTLQPLTITVVDDASREPVALSGPEAAGVEVVRFPENRGISAGRNAGVARGRSPFVACVNIEVLLAPDWLERCVAHLVANPKVGAAGARTSPQSTSSTLGFWRSLVQEQKYPRESGPINWLPGHAVLFRREAIEAIKGYDERMKRAHEDVDICARLRDAGWGVEFVRETSAVSIQEDSLQTLARAEYNRFCWNPAGRTAFTRSLAILTGRGLLRVGIHTLKRHWRLVPVEAGIWWYGVRWAWRMR